MTWDLIARDLRWLCTGGVQQRVPLRMLSRWRIGGTATVVVEPGSENEISDVLRYINANEVNWVAVGEGSNLLFDDAGLDAVAIKVGRRMAAVALEGHRLRCQAGIWVPHLVRRTASLGLSGIQHAIGIPGTLGGLVCMNGGSQRSCIGESIVNVTYVNREGEINIIDRDECRFAYRRSVFQGSDKIIVGCTLEMQPSNMHILRCEMLAILRERRQKFPLKMPNCGSVFASDPEMYNHVGPPGKAIEESKLKGLRIGDAEVSVKHANFIVNCGQATSTDVLALIHQIRRAVYGRTGFWMDCEVRHVGQDGRIRMSHEVAEERFGLGCSQITEKA